VAKELLTVSEVLPALESIAGKRFGEFMPPGRLAALRGGGNINKGMVGQVLEQVLGVGNSSRTLDLADGELKTHKSTPAGVPMETVAVTMVSTIIDELFDHRPFDQTRVYKKLNRTIFVPAYRDRSANPEDWMFLRPVFVDLDDPAWFVVKERLHRDYDSICLHTQTCFSAGDKMLHGTPAPNRVLQIRTKDSAPYSPIYSARAGRYVSNKNYAFYLTKGFVDLIHKTSGFKRGVA
jgi:DNA mismatch repair protein MutH